MEYRLRYREIPWGVAICVLPGKVLGRFVVDPIEYCAKYWRRLLRKTGKILLFLVIATAIVVLAFMLFEAITDGNLSKGLLNLWVRIQALFADTPATPIVDGVHPEL